MTQSEKLKIQFMLRAAEEGYPVCDSCGYEVFEQECQGCGKVSEVINPGDLTEGAIQIIKSLLQEVDYLTLYKLNEQSPL